MKQNHVWGVSVSHTVIYNLKNLLSVYCIFRYYFIDIFVISFNLDFISDLILLLDCNFGYDYYLDYLILNIVKRAIEIYIII